MLAATGFALLQSWSKDVLAHYEIRRLVPRPADCLPALGANSVMRPGNKPSQPLRRDLSVCFKHIRAAKTEQAFAAAVAPLLSAYPLLVFGIERGDIYWRARTWPQGQVTPFSKVSDLSYPPPHVVTKSGRLNKAGDPCFYASKSLAAALLEVNAEPGQMIQVAGFAVLLGEELKLAHIGEYAAIYKSGPGALTDPRAAAAVSMSMARPSEFGIRDLALLDEFYAGVLNDPEAEAQDYMHSRTLCQLIHQKQKIAGILYPSVKRQGQWNIAIRPSAVDTSLHNVSCILVKVLGIDANGAPQYEIVQQARKMTAEQSFEWEQGPPHQQLISAYNMTYAEYQKAQKGGLTHLLPT